MKPFENTDEFRERIRQLCARAVTSDGEEFQTILLELENAIELLQSVNEKDGDQRAARAG